jgi:hypothetical protein
LGALPTAHEYAERDRELGERREARKRGITFLKPAPRKDDLTQGRHRVREREELRPVQWRQERLAGIERKRNPEVDRSNDEHPY